VNKKAEEKRNKKYKYTETGKKTIVVASHHQRNNNIIIMSNGAAQAGASSLGMASENFGFSNVRLRRTKKLQFGVVDPNELVSSIIYVVVD
jgi:hypothetical protein